MPTVATTDATTAATTTTVPVCFPSPAELPPHLICSHSPIEHDKYVEANIL